jgi:hypothetical protein
MAVLLVYLNAHHSPLFTCVIMQKWNGKVFASRLNINPTYSVGYTRDISGLHFYNERPKKNKARGMISKKAQSRVRTAMNWLMFFSERKYVWSKEKKKGFWFKLNFITLTLSNTQKHSDRYIVEHLLQPFLKYIGRKYNAKNYIWKAEIQPKRLMLRGERCIHFHITTNKFIPYMKIRNKWNSLQVAHGYLTKEYDANSTDIHSVINNAEIVYYMSKYISKEQGIADVIRKIRKSKFITKEEKEKVSKLTLSELKVAHKALRVDCKIWGCNHMLSTLGLTLKEEELNTFWTDTKEFESKFCKEKVQKDYCVLLKTNFNMKSKLPESIRAGLAELSDKFRHKDNDVLRYETEAPALTKGRQVTEQRRVTKRNTQMSFEWL